jgi:hypothetical protein
VLEIESDPYSLFIFGLRSPKTREKCIGRLRAFFDYIQIPEGDIALRSKVFTDRVKRENSTEWVLANMLKFFQHQKERFERKEITAGTIKNHYQAVKSFCDINDLPIPWKKLRKGLPKVRRFADDRAPTIGFGDERGSVTYNVGGETVVLSFKNPVFGFNACSIGGNIGGSCIAGAGQNAKFTYNLNNQTLDKKCYYEASDLSGAVTGQIKTTCY